MMKRTAAILGLAGMLAIGTSSTAVAAGDPLYVDVNLQQLCPVPNPGGSCMLPRYQAGAASLLGPDSGVVCSPSNQTEVPVGPVHVWVCKQQ